jgi:nitroreductase
MNIFEAINQRRAVKHFDPQFSISTEQERKLIEYGMQSPSSFNIQHWRIVVVRDTDLRKKIRSVSYNQSQITDSSLLFIVTADIKAWNKNPHRYLRNTPPEVQQMLVPWIEPFYSNNEQLQRDEALRSVGLISQTLMLAAKGLDFDSCPMIGFEADKVAELINLPPDHLIGMIICIGKALKSAWPKPGFLDYEEVVVKDKF